MTIDFYARNGFALTLWIFTQNHTRDKRETKRGYKVSLAMLIVSMLPKSLYLQYIANTEIQFNDNI